MTRAVQLTGEVSHLGATRTLRIELVADGQQEPMVSFGYADDADPISTLRADGVTSRIALVRLAATAREVGVWSEQALTIPGPEWPRGVPPCVFFAMDFGTVTFRRSRLRGTVMIQFTFYMGGDQHHHHTFTCEMAEVQRFGRELTDVLGEMGKWDVYQD